MIVARSRPSVPEAADGVRDGGSGGAEPPEELAATLEALRGELLELREIAEREQAGHAAALERVARLERELEEATSRSMRAYEAIDELRSQIEEVRAAAAGLPVAPPLVVEEQQPEAQPEQREPGTPPEEPSPTGPLEAARLEAALSRLREAAPTPALPEESTGVSVGPPPRASRPWLTGVLRRMLERDPNAAGRLVLALLPAQRLVSHRPLAYDLVLAEDGCIQVTVAGEYWSVVRSDGPRNLQAVQFSVATDLAGLARYVATGKARRLRRRRRAVISGDRDLARALPALVGVPLSVSELVTAGVRFDPLSALSVVALMIDPAWTAGERFTIAYQPAAGSDEAVWLVVRDGAPIAVLETLPAEPVGTTIVCEPDALLRLLDGGLVPEARVGPDPRLLTVLQGWMKRAQSG